MLMMVETVGMSMLKSSSGPIDSAWALLKAPEEGLNELQDAMSSHLSSLSEPEHLFVHTINHAIRGMSPENQQRMGQQVEELLKPHMDNLPQILSSMHGKMPIHGNQGRLRKSIEFQLRKGFWDTAKKIGGAALTVGAIAGMIAFPGVIPLVFAVDAINRSQGSKGSIIGEGFKSIGKYIAQPLVNQFFGEGTMDIDTDWGSVGVIGLNDEAYIGGHIGATSGFVDPVLGHKWSESEDVGWGTRLMHIGAAAASAFSPGTYLRAGRAATGATTGAIAGTVAPRLTASAQRSGAATRAGREAAEDASHGMMGLYADDVGREATEATALQTRRGEWGESLRDFANQRRFGGPDAHWTNLGVANPISTPAAMGWRALQAAGPTGGTSLLFGTAANYLTPDIQPGTDWDPSGATTSGSGSGSMPHSYGGGPAGTHASPYGQGDIHTGHSERTGLATLHSEAGGHRPTGHWTELDEAVGTGSYGSQFQMGEDMEIGDRMLKELTEMMYKAATCPCGKAPCICKEYKNKKDDKKKPAHGMVIVIGTKAGPGPSTDGKRDKLDSEKDEKDE